MITGVNHITIAISDLEPSWWFYVDLLGFTPKARWDKGAYLRLGDMWFCLSIDDKAGTFREDYSHIAFSIDPSCFSEWVAKLQKAKVREWKQNISEGQSFYFLDPDGNKLEAHCGDLNSRLRSLKQRPYKGLQFF